MMRFLLTVMVLLCVAVAPAFGSAESGQPPDKALCTVCAAHGEREMEKVRAEALFEGKTYYFCGEDCREQFLADPAGFIPLPLPREAPPFTATALDQRTVSLADYAGSVVLVDFWATWCKPCVQTMPKLEALHQAHAKDGLRIVGMSIDDADDRAERVAKFVKRQKISYPVLLDAWTTPAWDRYRVKSIPSMFLIDREGRIIAEWKGAVEMEEVEVAVRKAVGAR